MTCRRRRLWPFGLVLCVLLVASPVLACSVPVFRYALERWVPGSYMLIVFHREPLGAEDQEAVELARSVSFEGNGKANIGVRVVKISGDMDDFTRGVWSRLGSPETPWSVLLYPVNLMQPPGPMGWGEPAPPRPPAPIAWSGRLTTQAVKEMLDSPARTEIARRIIDGHSAVWIYLGDAKGARDLEVALNKAEKELTLPEIDPYDTQWGPGGSPLDDLSKTLRLQFSVLRLDPKDATEKFLIDMLLGIEPDLRTTRAGGAMAFPVFGRGRALCVLIGKDITPENIGSACAFLTGPCSCMIKEQNPGTDLLMTADWDAAVPQPTIQVFPIPPLTDLSRGVSPDQVLPSPSPTTEPAAVTPLATADAATTEPVTIARGSALTGPATAHETLTRDVVVVAVVVVGITAAVAWAIRRQSSGR